MSPARRVAPAPVRFYYRHVLPRIIDRLCAIPPLGALRRRVCAGLAGDVVEIGFGSGLNVPFYPPEVTGVAAIEPADLSWRLAARRVRAARIPVRRSGQDARALPFPDGSFDAALSTWTLCTIPDPAAALREVRRVLRPGAALQFLEHGLAPDEAVRRWQRRLDPVERCLAGGCHFTEPVIALLEDAGFAIGSVDVFYQRGIPKFTGCYFLGTAVPAGSRAAAGSGT